MDQLLISTLEASDAAVEVVERKGLGHPDTICDALAETLSRNLCREYLRRFGTILHHNVDKALLRGGQAVPAFEGGVVTEPIDIYLAGRAVFAVGPEHLPIREIAIEGSRVWLADNLHALDADRHVRLHELIGPGSADLQALFSRQGSGKVPLANDTSFGVGHAPLSALEHLVLAIEKQINSNARTQKVSAWGEDVKVMGVRCGTAVQITVACALIGRFLAHLDDYLAEKCAIEKLVRNLAAEHGFPSCDVYVNAADDRQSESIYLTVTGTSAESGDDGQVGRGNRANGLITPCRPMSLEAAAGKNPVSHVGKLYNVMARKIAETLVGSLPEISKAECLLLSRIGAPVTSPALIQIKLATQDGAPIPLLRQRIEEIVADCVARIPHLVHDFLAGRAEVY